MFGTQPGFRGDVSVCVHIGVAIDILERISSSTYYISDFAPFKSLVHTILQIETCPFPWRALLTFERLASRSRPSDPVPVPKDEPRRSSKTSNIYPPPKAKEQQTRGGSESTPANWGNPYKL